MQYVSTRGGVESCGFEQVLLEGQARDGGLFLPQSFPDFSSRLSEFKGLSFADLAFEIVSAFATDLDSDRLRNILNEAFAEFTHDHVVPLIRHDGTHILELFHGPTLAFKDVALQVLGRLFEQVLSDRGEVMNIVGATSGDTGSAAIAGVYGRPNIGIFILFPDGRTSKLQELQMTTIIDPNVHCLAIDGSFDDCQSILKELYSDVDFKTRKNLGAVNSINWSRILVQMVYYVYAALKFDEPVTFSVPTGNFGNALSGILAMRMGIPIRKLVIGTNENDILARFFSKGVYRLGSLQQTLSPSMDIQVASNLERFVYLHQDKDPNQLIEFMTSFTKHGHAELCMTGPVDTHIEARQVDTNLTIDTISTVWNRHHYLLDPHSAVGVAAANLTDTEGPVICLATAHPAKFPEAVKRAIGEDIARHPLLDAISNKRSRKKQLPADVNDVRDYLDKYALST